MQLVRRGFEGKIKTGLSSLSLKGRTKPQCYAVEKGDDDRHGGDEPTYGNDWFCGHGDVFARPFFQVG